MRDGIDARPVTLNHEFAAIVNELAEDYDVSPLLVYAIRLNETAEGFPPGNLQDGADPATGKMPDGSNAGHGIMQLTSEWPPHWQDPETNFRFAIDGYIEPDWEDGVEQTGLQADALVRFIAASYNAGYEAALTAHARGDVDAVTTDRYGDRALAHYKALLAEAEAAPPVPARGVAERAGNAGISWENRPTLGA